MKTVSDPSVKQQTRLNEKFQDFNQILWYKHVLRVWTDCNIENVYVICNYGVSP